MNKAAVSLLRESQLDDCVEELDRVRRIFQGESHSRLLGPMADLMLKAGRMLITSGHPQEALTLFDAIRERWADSPAPPVQKRVAHANFWAAIALGELGRFEDAVRANEAVMYLGEPAIAALNEIGKLVSRSQADANRQLFAWTLLARAGAEKGPGEHDRSSATMAEIIDKFRDDVSPMVQLAVSEARQGLEQHEDLE
jgi:hypothetical protein